MHIMKVSFNEFISLFKNNNELCILDIQKALGFELSYVGIQTYARLASLKGLITIEKGVLKGNKHKKIYYRKVG